MLLRHVYEALERNQMTDFVLEGDFFKRTPGIIYRWMCNDELLNIYWGSWELVGFDDYAEDAHDPKYDGMYFKSFSTQETPEQNKAFYDDVLVAFDEKGLASIGAGTKLVKYVYDKETQEYEKRLVSPHVLLPKESIGGKYWKLIKGIYVPKHEFKKFKEDILPEFEDNPEDLPKWAIIKNIPNYGK